MEVVKCKGGEEAMKKNKMVLASVVLVAMLVFASWGYLNAAAKGTNSSIKGTITDHDGTPLAGMRVIIVNGTTFWPEIAIETNWEGYYQIGSVSPGTFEVAVHDRHGNRIGLGSVTVRSGETSMLNFVIQ